MPKITRVVIVEKGLTVELMRKALRLQGWKTRLTGAVVIAYVWAIALVPKALGIQNGPPVHVAIYVTGLVLMLLWIHATGRRIERKLDERR